MRHAALRSRPTLAAIVLAMLVDQACTPTATAPLPGGDWDLTGRAVLERDAVVSLYAADAHEVAHLLTAPRGRPLRLAHFWLEGIAMYYTWAEVYFGEEELARRGLPRSIGVWSGRTVHAWAQEAHRRGELPALTPLVHGNRSFRSLDDALAYTAAGSFTTFLLGPGHRDLARVAAFRAFLDDANTATDVTEVRAAFARHLGLGLGAAEAAWHDFLAGWAEPTPAARRQECPAAARRHATGAPATHDAADARLQ
jgi:hypothetical protein